MCGHLMPPIRRERLERLLAIARRSSETWRRRQLGTTANVLWERESDGFWQGLTPNYVRVFASHEDDLTNRITPTQLTALHDEGVLGTIVP